MAITTNALKDKDIDFSLCGPRFGFEAAQSDVNFFEDPDNAGVQVVSKGISLLNPSNEAVSLHTVDGRTITIPAGFLADGVMHPIAGVIRFNDTGSGASVRLFVWI